MPSPQYAVKECQFAEVAAFLRFAIGRYEVDEARVYLTGISCGAEATWDYLAEHGDDLVAAAAPIAGAMPPGTGCAPAAVPVWAFHGEDDEFFTSRDVSSQIQKLKDCDGAQVELTLYPDPFHDSWSKTYDLSAGHDVYAWLLEHER